MKVLKHYFIKKELLYCTCANFVHLAINLWRKYHFGHNILGSWSIWSLHFGSSQFGFCYFQFVVNLILTVNSLMENNYIVNGMHMWHANIIIKNKNKKFTSSSYRFFATKLFLRNTHINLAFLTLSSHPPAKISTEVVEVNHKQIDKHRSCWS